MAAVAEIFNIKFSGEKIRYLTAKYAEAYAENTKKG